ncbi:MAG: heme A synthase [Planctomycetes bacterium]|nr:heme A synthase [Planctomycetota bacterium]
MRWWLVATFGLVFVMVLVGGATRLTGSGLSMVDWSAVGSAPPTDEAGWKERWDLYAASPEARQVNPSMTLEEFKGIFWWEYVHRMLGRLVGVVYGVPWLVFLIRKRLKGRMLFMSTVALVLGGLQGGVGWWMVKSGLVSRPEVSHYRLAVHLGLALFIAMWLLWMMLELQASVREYGRERSRGRRATIGLLVLVAVQTVWGAFMAGKKAGWRYDTWPDMDGRFLPEAAFPTAGAWVEDGATIHWIHRTLAWVIAAAAVAWWWRARRDASTFRRRAAHAVLAAVGVQFVLGVATILAHVPVTLGVAHQAGAFALLAALVTAVHSGGPAPAGRIGF